MPFEGPSIRLAGLKAGADLSAAANQYKFVKLSADKTVVLCAAVTDIPIGVLQEPCANGDAADVLAVGQSMVQADASLSAGNLIGTSADGQAAALTPGTDTTKFIVGQVINVAGATSAGNLVTAAINCLSPCRAA